MSSTPIADHALLSDRHSAALVSREGSVEWLCFPRFDSPSVFGRLLDDEAGHWSIRPAGDFQGHPALPGPRRWCWRRRSRTATGTVSAHRRAGAGRRTSGGTTSGGTPAAC